MKAESAATKPPSLPEIFGTFLVIGLTAFGGGASAHIHEAVARRRKWIDETRMIEGMTLARVIPGTNVSNLAAFVGSLLAGYRGAAVALCGVVAPGLLFILALAVGYAKFAEQSHAIQAGLHGLTAGAVGIMASLVIDAARPIARSPPGLLFAAAAFIGVGVFQVNMLLVLAALMPLASWIGPRQGAS